MALSVSDCFDFLGVNDDGDDGIESLWVRIREEVHQDKYHGRILLQITQPGNQDEETDKIFCHCLGDVSWSLDLVLV